MDSNTWSNSYLDQGPHAITGKRCIALRSDCAGTRPHLCPQKNQKSAPEFHVLSSVASEYISFKFSVWYQRAGTNKPLLNDWGVASVQSYIHKYKKKSEMTELLTLVMIENSSKNLIIRPSESIKPELLDERILDMTKIVKWSTFRSGLSQLKSRIA